MGAGDRNTKLRKHQLADASVDVTDLETTNSASDKQIPSYDSDSGKFKWVDALIALWTGYTEKTTPVDNDIFLINDSASSNVLKKTLWTDIKATLKTYFDGLYKATFAYTAEDVANKSTNVTTDGASDTKYPSVKAVKTYVDNSVIGLLDYRGGYNASGNTYPTTGGSGTEGAILKGDLWIISIAGTLGGVAVQVGDAIVALVDTPGQTSSNWNSLNGNIAYVPEDVANKSTDGTLADNSITKYPSQSAVKTYADTKIPAPTSPQNGDLLYYNDGWIRLSIGTAGQTLKMNFDAFTKAMLHCDGINGATSFTDEIGKSITNTANYDSYTKLMLHGSASPFVDACSSPKAVTNTAVTLDSVNTILGKPSMAFNGTSAKLDLADSADWIGGNCFTMEFDIIHKSATPQCLCSQMVDASNYMQVYYDGSLLQFVLATAAGGILINFKCTYAFQVGNKYHIEIERLDGGNTAASWNISIEGVAQTLTLLGGAWNATYPNIAANLTIGAYTTGAYWFNGNMGEFRFSQGIARYPVTGFTPPTAPFGQVYVDTSVKKFGTGLARFLGSGESLSLAYSADWNFGSGAFTLDNWYSFSDINSNQWLAGQLQDANNYMEFQYSGGYLYWAVYVSGTYVLNFKCTLNPTQNTLYHIALVRVDNSNSATGWRIFINGVSQTLTLLNGAWNATMPDLATAWTIGGTPGYNVYFNGNIDELRISKGIARWTSNFTPPVSVYIPLPIWST